MIYKIKSPILIGATSWKLLSEIEKANIHSFSDKYETVIEITSKDTYYMPHYISDPYDSIVFTTNIYEEFKSCFDYNKLKRNIEVDKNEIISKLDDIIIRDKIISILETKYNYKIR